MSESLIVAIVIDGMWCVKFYWISMTQSPGRFTAADLGFVCSWALLLVMFLELFYVISRNEKPHA